MTANLNQVMPADDAEIIKPGAALVGQSVSAVLTPMAMIANAVANGASLEMVERLMALQERMETNEARKAYVAAMAEFKAVPLAIGKNKKVSFDTGKGKTEYTHATLDTIADTVGPVLARFGLSYRWETEQLDGGQVQVTCIVRHALGHSERTTLKAGLDQTGGKNNIQALGSTVSYLERYSLMAALGLASGEQDDDGRGSDTGFIDATMIEQIQDSLAKSGGDVQAFCKWLKVNSLAEIPVKALGRVWEALEAKRVNADAARAKQGSAA